MKTQCIYWSVLFTLCSCAASAGEAPWEADQRAPAAIPADPCPQDVPVACPGQADPRPRWRIWWQDSLKPCLQYSHWGYCDQFEEIPFGDRLRAHQQAQVCSGWAARLWLYRYDFCDDGAGLNAAGHKRLTELAREFPVWSHHVLVIETTPGKSQLDAARREHVAKLLEGAGVPAQVVIGVPTVSAPFGDETRDWNTLFLRQVRSGGGQMGGSSGGAMSGAAAAQPSAQ